jgi:hypothetical protein
MRVLGSWPDSGVLSGSPLVEPSGGPRALRGVAVSLLILMVLYCPSFVKRNSGDKYIYVLIMTIFVLIMENGLNRHVAESDFTQCYRV